MVGKTSTLGFEQTLVSDSYNYILNISSHLSLNAILQTKPRRKTYTSDKYL